MNWIILQQSWKHNQWNMSSSKFLNRELAAAVHYEWLCQFDSMESYLQKDKREGDKEQNSAMLLSSIKVISEKLCITC